MAYTYKVYQENQLWNLDAVADGPTAADVLLSANSNATFLSGRVTAGGHTYDAQFTGNFSYSGLRISLNDVSGTYNTSVIYRDGLAWESTTSTVGLDIVKMLFGTDLNYRLSALQGNDVFTGSSTSTKSDYVRAEAGNDTFTGYNDDVSTGGDYFYGGAGVDTSVYRGKLSEYTIAKKTDIWDAMKSDGMPRLSGYSVTDKTAGRDGTDKLIDVERLKFSDGNLALDKDAGQNAGEAYRMYKAALDRTPDPVGLGGWIKVLDDGGSLASVASGFIYSPEFQNKYGINPDDGTFVTLLYRNVLHRGPDPLGFEGWTNALKGGASRESVLIGFSESTENINQTTAQLVGIVYQEWAS